MNRSMRVAGFVVVLVASSAAARTVDAAPHQRAAAAPTCDAIIDRLEDVVFAYNPMYIAFATPYEPKVLASCNRDHWPIALKRCIGASSPEALLAHACDRLISDALALRVLARVAPGHDIRPADYLRR